MFRPQLNSIFQAKLKSNFVPSHPNPSSNIAPLLPYWKFMCPPCHLLKGNSRVRVLRPCWCLYLSMSTELSTCQVQLTTDGRSASLSCQRYSRSASLSCQRYGRSASLSCQRYGQSASLSYQRYGQSASLSYQRYGRSASLSCLDMTPPLIILY